MADLSITMHGDASGAAGAMKDVAHEASALHQLLEGGLKGALGSTVGALTSFEAAGEKVVDIFKESLQEYAKAETALRQLSFVAKENTEAFEAQAKAISESFAVKDEDVEHLQTLALRYGVLPSQIEGATKGVLNFAAATGTDANSAMMMLIRGIENGTGSLGRMGIHFQSTGDTAKDMAKVIEILNDPEHFGGAGETEAGGLAGRLRRTEIATEDLKKAWGGFMASVEEKFGILEKVSNVLKNMSDSRAWSGGTRGVTWNEKAAPGIVDPKGGGLDVTMGELSLQSTPEAIKKQQEQLEAHLQAENKYLDSKWVLLQEDIKKEQEHDDEILKGKRQLSEMEIEVQAETLKKAEESSLEATKQMLKQAKEEQDDLRKLSDVTVSNLTGQKHMWESAGMQLGQAFSSALENAMEGGTQSAEDIALDLTQSVLTLAGGILGSIAGEGDPYAAQAGSMLGHLAGAGIKAGVHASHKHHDGGWIGERFHGGGWPALSSDEQLITAQHGERMLSRPEVNAMGGPAAVDAMARGRGGGNGLHIHIQATDTRSAREFFENDGGRGFYNALRTGRGSISSLMGSR
jgi:hypothetical protein